MQDQTFGQTGGIALGFGANTSLSFSLSIFKCTDLFMIDVPGPSLLSSSTQENSAKAAPPQATPQQPPAPALSKPNYDPFASISSTSHPPSGSTTPAMSSSFLQSQQRPPPPSQPSPDPFTSPSFRQSSPLPQHNGPSQASISSSLFDFASPAPQTAQPPSQPTQTTNGAATDEDWDFASALPDDGLPPSNQLVVSNTSVNITFKASRIGQSSDAVSLMAQFSNNTPTLITEYTFQVAVTRVRHNVRAPPSEIDTHHHTGSGVETYTTIWADVASKSKGWHHTTYHDQRRAERASEHHQDAVESIVQDCWRLTARARGSTSARYCLNDCAFRCI